MTAVLTTIGGFNNYDADKAADVLGAFVPECMEVRIEAFVGGPAIYFKLPFWTHQSIEASKEWHGQGEPLTSEQRRAVARRLRDAGSSLHADEIGGQQYPAPYDGTGWKWHPTGESPSEIRLWWD